MITHELILSRLAELRATAEALPDPQARWRVEMDELVDEAGETVATLYEFLPRPDVGLEGLRYLAAWSPAFTLPLIAWIEQVVREYAPEASGLDASLDLNCRVGIRDTNIEPYLGDLILAGLAGALGLEET